MLACDGQEAEFATVPIDYQGDGCLRLASEVTRCRVHMLKLLHSIGVPEVRGYSTHLNISAPPGREWELATVISATIAPALILLMEARQSPGLLIRPRRGRLEIGSEYIDDTDQLAAAIVFLTGTVQAYLFDGLLWAQFPRLSLKRWEEANIRPGIFLPHDAYSESIYAYGRAANLELENGGHISAGELLEGCSRLALAALAGKISPRSAHALRRLVDQTGSLQIERPLDPAVIARPVGFHAMIGTAQILQTITRSQDKFGLTPRFVDWEGAAFSWESEGNSLVVGVPWAHLPQFFINAQNNDIPAYVGGLGPVESELASLNQLQSPGVFRGVNPIALGTQALGNKDGGKNNKSGSSKPSVELPSLRILQNPIRPPWLTIGLVFIILLVSVLTILQLTGVFNNFRRSEQTPTITVTGSLPAQEGTVTRLMPTVTTTFTNTPTSSTTSTATLVTTLTYTPSATLIPTQTHTPLATLVPTQTRSRSATPVPTRTRRPVVPPTPTIQSPPPQPTPCDPASPGCSPTPQPTVCDPLGNCH